MESDIQPPAGAPAFCEAPERDGHWEFFKTEASWKVSCAISDAVESHDGGGLSLPEFTRQVQELTTRWPGNIDAAQTLASLLSEEGRQEEADEEYRRALELGLAAIGGRKIRLRWYVHPNRPFLRAAAGCIHALERKQQVRKAIALTRKVLRWCPQDGLGLRHRLAPLLLRNGKPAAAIRHLRKLVDEDRSQTGYDLGLAHFMLGEYAEACRWLRWATALNPYTCEMLVSGTREVMRRAIWTGSNVNGQDGALWYAEEAEATWTATPNALAFLRWVETEPRFVAERNEVHHIDASLMAESSVPERQVLLDRRARLLAKLGIQDNEDLIRPRATSPRADAEPRRPGDNQAGEQGYSEGHRLTRTARTLRFRAADERKGPRR